MASRRFPRAPRGGRVPLEHGENPFADREPAAGTDSGTSSPLQAPRSHEYQPYVPGEWETTLPDRSGRLLLLGMAGALFTGVSCLIAGGMLATGAWEPDRLASSLPPGLVGLAGGIPAWYLAAQDLRAIRAGAMAADGRKKTQQAYALGVAATLLAAIPLVLMVWSSAV